MILLAKLPFLAIFIKSVCLREAHVGAFLQADFEAAPTMGAARRSEPGRYGQVAVISGQAHPIPSLGTVGVVGVDLGRRPIRKRRSFRRLMAEGWLRLSSSAVWLQALGALTHCSCFVPLTAHRDFRADHAGHRVHPN